ncbi:MAG: RICIN domain-containing protein, partial [Melioribacteraceae bacterium]|nr:RICIN domain-containing protein [Melioribacteraceae bacterium]
MKQIVKIILVAVALSSILNAQNDNDLIPKDKVFYIQSAINYGKDNKGFWDLPGEKDFALNQQFKVWEYNIPEKKNYFQFSTDVDGDRKIKFFTAKNSEYIEMRLAGVNAFVEVYKGDDKNGTNIVINEKNNNSSQNFRFVYVNEGGFKIYNENSKILQLEDQNSNNGSKIVLGDDNDGTHTEWVLISDETRKPLSFPNKPKIESRQEGWADMSGIGRFIVQSVNNYGKNRGGCWDISGNDDPKKGDNIQVWDLSGVAPDRVYSLEEAQNKAYYNIIVGPSLGSDVVVDLHGNKYRNGSNIGTWEPGNSPAQNFYFKHLGGGKFKIYNQNNKILSLDNSSSKNG